MGTKLKTKKYYVSGMHCSSCELLVEKRLLEENGVTFADASLGDSSLTVNYTNSAPKTEKLNSIFKESGYTFTDEPTKVSEKTNQPTTVNDWIIAICVIASIVSLFYILNKLGVASLVSVTSNSSLAIFFLFGLIAGSSTCAALVGGIVLSMSKEWNSMTKTGKSNLTPHIRFNLGRVISFSILGAVLGAFGSVIKFSIGLGAVLTIAVSILIIVIALQMLGVKYFQNLRIGLPKFLTRYMVNEKKFNNKWMPMVIGILTVLLPCGFTITVQSLALASGSWLNGMLMMLAFVLGTTPILLFIGLSSGKLLASNHFSKIFSIVAGVLILAFGVYNINSQLTVLGIPNLRSAISLIGKEKTTDVDVTDGIQIIKMDASGSDYSPNEFTVKKGIPVRWEVTNKGVTGCTNAIIAKDFFAGNFKIDKDVVVKEFTPMKTGKFYFTCWMGMAYGTITVVE